MDFGTYQPDGVVEGIDHSGAVALGVIANSTINTKGSYVELTSSLPQDITGFWLFLMQSSGNTTAMSLIDVSVGSAGNEESVASNIQFGSLAGTSDLRCLSIYIPVRIASGQRVSTRIQSNVSSNNMRISIVYNSSNYGGFTQSYAKAVGISVSSISQAATVDPGSTVNTKGSWEVLFGSTDVDYSGLIIYSPSSNDDETRVSSTWLFDVALDDGSVPATLIENLYSGGHSNHDGFGAAPLFIPVNIPKSTAIYARAQCSINDSNSRLLAIGQIYLR